MFVVGASSDLGQTFRPRQKHLGFGWEESRLSHYDICAEGALLPSITVIARMYVTNDCHLYKKVDMSGHQINGCM